MNNDVIDYINKKREYIRKDYKLRFWFENSIVEENESLYLKKMSKLEEKMTLCQSPRKMHNFFQSSCVKTWKKEKKTAVKTIHCAGLAGFSEVDVAFNANVCTNYVVLENAQIFLGAFEKLVSNKAAIPNRSVIILSPEEHHVTKQKRPLSVPRSIEKKRRVAAVSRGQQSIKVFFPAVKSADTTTTQKETQEEEQRCEQYKVDEIIARVRGSSSEIRVLWVPRVELNPSSYVSVVFNNEVMRYIDEYENSTLQAACSKVIDTLPNEIWSTYYNYISQSLEESFLEAHEKKMKGKENNQSDGPDSDFDN